MQRGIGKRVKDSKHRTDEVAKTASDTVRRHGAQELRVHRLDNQNPGPIGTQQTVYREDTGCHDSP